MVNLSRQLPEPTVFITFLPGCPLFFLGLRVLHRRGWDERDGPRPECVVHPLSGPLQQHPLRRYRRLQQLALPDAVDVEVLCPLLTLTVAITLHICESTVSMLPRRMWLELGKTVNGNLLTDQSLFRTFQEKSCVSLSSARV